MKPERKTVDTPKRETAFDAHHARHEPGGVITLDGPYFAAHRHEILGFVRELEAEHKADDPAKAIVAIEPHGEGVVVTTAEAHLARALVHALHGAYKGEVETHTGERPLRASWRR